jgi:hypothetical protein
MARLYYGNMPEPIELPDRVLAHLKIVISTKLRRSESFPLSWQYGSGPDAERSTIWLHAAIPLRFEVAAAAASDIDRAYLHELVTAANSSGGVVVDLAAEDEISDVPKASELVRAA